MTELAVGVAPVLAEGFSTTWTSKSRLAGGGEPNPDQALAQQEAVRRLLLGERGDRRVRAVRAVVQPEQRIGAAGGVEHGLDLGRRDRHGSRGLMTVHAGAPVGAQALKERVVLIDRRAVDR